MMPALFAVVVAYAPERDALGQLCRTLAQDATVIVVDNTPGGEALLPNDVCTWICNGENLGIATGQNIGIREALRQGAQAIAFFDQDSAPSPGLLPALAGALAAPGAGVVVPVCCDAASGKEYPSFRMNRWGWPAPVYLGASHAPTAVDFAISSGSLASAAVFAKAGLMDDSLFIDYVDFEWCARVRAAGFSIVVAPAARMRHAIGQFSVQSAGLNVIMHGPVRCYYRVRNAFHLFRYRHIRLLYAVHQLLAALVHHLLQWRHSDDPRLHLKMGWLGVKDGLMGRRGRLKTE
jgi:rhamnosyltransferase